MKPFEEVPFIARVFCSRAWFGYPLVAVVWCVAGVKCLEIFFPRFLSSHYSRVMLSSSFITISRATCQEHVTPFRKVAWDTILKPCCLTVGIWSLDHKELISLIGRDLLVHFESWVISAHISLHSPKIAQLSFYWQTWHFLIVVANLIWPSDYLVASRNSLSFSLDLS